VELIARRPAWNCGTLFFGRTKIDKFIMMRVPVHGFVPARARANASRSVGCATFKL
jgi:hypothetical protein